MIQSEYIDKVAIFRLARSFAGRPFYFTSAYWIDGLMVDTGCAHTVSDLISAVADLKIHTIVNTHSHEDHVGANAVLSSRFGATILAHASALPILRNPGLKHLRPYQRIMWGGPDSSAGHPLEDIVETHKHRFQVIYTPGHSPDHISLFEPDEGWLFCGDAYVGGRDRALRRDYNIWQILSSLKTMADLGPSILFPGSGNAKRDATAELRAKIAYLEEIGQRVLDLDKKGWSRRRIRQNLFGAEMPIAYFTLGHFSGKNLVRSYIDDNP
jgi:glyoxylase-like metal-dependent hydrolase (beta-lactamase superfamily II)